MQLLSSWLFGTGSPHSTRFLTVCMRPLPLSVSYLEQFFLAWRDEHTKLEQEKQKRGRPEITAEFKAFGGVPRQWALFIHNSSDSPAINLHIDDIRHNEKVLRFIPISAVSQDNDYPVKCGILHNGWTQTDNVASLWDGETFIGMSPMFDLHIRFSNFDSLNAQKNWIVSARFWWNVQQQVIEMSHQSIEFVK